MDSWIHDPYLWIRRSALLFQLQWKGEIDSERLFSYCILQIDEKEFFIRKAIGWVLREYSKTEKMRVLSFIKKEGHRLSPLSLREASRYLQ
jgi:3-methyladenine DNA glycosylase AlkD